jgi:Leucine-rich repeat (LRR) protein
LLTTIGIPHLSYGWLPASLEWLDVSHNQIETIEGVWSKSNGDLGSHQNQSHSKNERLRVVDASHNLITQLNHHAIPRNLEMLKLGFNKLIKIADDTFNHAHHLRRVELISNQLEKLSLNALRLPLNTKIKPELLLGGNPLLCSCEMVSFFYIK